MTNNGVQMIDGNASSCIILSDLNNWGQLEYQTRAAAER